MAVPGKIDSPLSRGAHQLIKQGATLIDSLDDIVDTLGYIGEKLKNHVTESSQNATEKIEGSLFDISQLKLNSAEKAVYDYLTIEPVHLEDIIAGANLSAGSINAALVSLRLKGLIKQQPGSLFCLKKTK